MPFSVFTSWRSYPDIDKKRCKEDAVYRHALVDDLLTGQAARIASMLNDGIDLVQLQIESVEQELNTGYLPPLIFREKIV